MARFYKRKTFKRKAKPSGMSWTSLAKKAWTGVKMLKGIINSEIKYFDGYTIQTPDYNGNMQPLSNMAEGDTNITRNGNSILAKDLKFHFSIIGAAAVQTQTRVILFYDSMQNGTAPVATDVLAAVGSTYGVVAPYSLIDKEQKRFHILHDHVYCTSGTGMNEVNVSLDSHLGNHHISYIGTTGGAGDQGKGSIYVLALSNLVTTNLPTITFYSRVSYYDN